MKKPIIGVTVGTTLNPKKLLDKMLNGVKKISPYSFSVGKGSAAGTMGYYIERIDFENKKIYLSGVKVDNGYIYINTDDGSGFSVKNNTGENFSSPITFKWYNDYYNSGSLVLSLVHNDLVFGECYYLGDYATDESRGEDGKYSPQIDKVSNANQGGRKVDHKIEINGIEYLMYKADRYSTGTEDWDESMAVDIYFRKASSTIISPDEVSYNGDVVGKDFSIINGYHYPFCGKIVSVVDNVITYEGDLGFTELVDTDSTRKYGHLFYVPESPECGCVDIGEGAVAFSLENYASAKGAFVAGRKNIVGGNYGAGFGRDNKVGYAGLVSGASNEQTNIAGTCFGVENENHGYISHVRGRYNVIPKGARYVNVDGVSNTVSGEYNSAKGYNNIISAGKVNSVCGTLNKIHDGNYNEVSGRSHEITGSDNHVEGHDHTVIPSTVANGRNHVEGYLNKVYSKNSHIQGVANEAKQLDDDGAEVTNIDLTGYHNIGNGSHQNVAGKYNYPKSNKARITGGGSSNSNRRNIEELDWNGNMWFRGNVYVGGRSSEDGAVMLVTKTEFDALVERVKALEG